MERNGFVFFAEYYTALQALETLTAEEQLAVYKAIVRKGLLDIDPNTEELPVAARAMWVFMAPKMEAYEPRSDTGNRGGRPKKNADADDAETAPAETETKPDGNRNETEAKPKRNRSKTEMKPDGNRNVTEAEPKGGNIKHKTQNIKHNISDPPSYLPPCTNTAPDEMEEEDDEREKETEMEPGDGAPPPVQPVDVDVRQVRSLCSKYGVDADEFIASYASRGWTIAGEPIRDMEALIRKCGENAKKKRAGAAAQAPPARQLEQSSFDADEFMLAALRRVYGEDVDYDT